MSDDLVAYYITWGDQGATNQNIGTPDGGPPDGEWVLPGVGPIKWYGRPDAFDGNATRFGVGQYKYTYIGPNGKLWASNDETKSQDFYYVDNSGGSFFSTSGGDMGHVWTLSSEGAGITIQDYNPGDNRQWFYPVNA